MTELDRKVELPVQPLDGFICPAWCAEKHDQGDVVSSEGAFHRGAERKHPTARGGVFVARLAWYECLETPIETDALAYGPFIEVDGHDDSGFGGFSEYDVLDLPAILAIMTDLRSELDA
ncbi:DUF6907 domain-containing protein [Aeromicrobium stalagmiti]|uniref:DUF6907 domain-containing protein n=1 Tax=Aeromicrobium stalagmiti TaxID=2738988 RepID=UPI00156898B3|nr:hypothetical protein [Aeromicrobium stalagmiti]NRQ51572.1 hypothetical protein [Aeromicrobium stalagmiti]